MMRAVQVGNGSIRHGVGRVQKFGSLHGFRPRVRKLERVVMRESLLDSGLQGVIPGVPDGLLDAYAGELRPGTQQVSARNVRRVNRVRAEKRVREGLAQ